MTTLCTLSDLSQEILQEIVCHLRGDTKTLQALSTVSSTFLPICRALLFYTLHWAANLRNCLNLGHFVRELNFDGEVLQRAQAERDVVLILDSTTHPETIKLGRQSYSPMDWTFIPVTVQPRCPESSLDPPFVMSRWQSFTLSQFPYFRVSTSRNFG
ncbi:hypothetical protein BDN72DRAFT_304690 [Pluteus cervinus]|uniref:Uncharacterized protein n=1 Tax=Pluteus cervinus TaxID=181527 RepID=A0ACD3B453_9AGAR|nr:hypothetical protein BDN72DRAFT_304690 [Pluteus cervinus]